MVQALAQVGSLRAKLAHWASNAWTRTAFEPAAARRIAGLRYWDGNCVS
ncbi:MAG: hypothetical protein JWP11_984 [Frankiales bacterium]|nr:hypothetical protein [Frankiales bacterium]